MAVEKLGGRQSGCAEDGPQSWYYLRSRKETQEEAPNRVHVFKS